MALSIARELPPARSITPAGKTFAVVQQYFKHMQWRELLMAIAALPAIAPTDKAAHARYFSIFMDHSQPAARPGAISKSRTRFCVRSRSRLKERMIWLLTAYTLAPHARGTDRPSSLDFREAALIILNRRGAFVADAGAGFGFQERKRQLPAKLIRSRMSSIQPAQDHEQLSLSRQSLPQLPRSVALARNSSRIRRPHLRVDEKAVALIRSMKSA